MPDRNPTKFIFHVIDASGLLLSYSMICYLGIRSSVSGRLFFAAQQRIAITLSPNYYQKMRCFTTRKNQEEHGPDVM